MKKIALFGFFAALGLGSLVTVPVLAAALEMGNEIIERDKSANLTDFAVVDNNNPAEADGVLSEFEYFASNTKPFNFILVDNNGRVRWMSEQITPSDTGEGLYEPEQDVEVQEGWNLGVYMTDGQTIHYSLGGEKARFTKSNTDVEQNDKLTYRGSEDRIYSISATGNDNSGTDEDEEGSDEEDSDDEEDEAGDDEDSDSTVDFPSELEPINDVLQNRSRCLAGQWAQIEGNHGFTNQGQCVAYYNQMIRGHIENLLRIIKQKYEEMVIEVDKEVKARNSNAAQHQNKKQAECSLNSDCDADEVCNNGKCKADVEENEDEDSEEGDEECTKNSDCDDDEICDDGECAADNDNEDSDENDDEDETECSKNSDCQNDEICDDGVCEEDK